MLGHWEAAYRDFCKAQLSDFDEDVQTWCKEIEPNVCFPVFLSFLRSVLFFLCRLRKLLNIIVNTNDVEKQKKPMRNENAFVKLKKLMLKHNKKKANDGHENNSFPDFQVTFWNN
jgi:hypothetical protein